MKRRWRRIPPDIRLEILRLAGEGLTGPEIAEKVGVYSQSVYYILQPLGGVLRREMWHQGTRRLCLQERIDIRVGLEKRLSLRCIARQLDRHPSTISREVKGNGGWNGYQPLAAHRRAELNARRPKAAKLARSPRLRKRVISDLDQLWSPQQIAARLAAEFGDDDSMRISHETIYKTLYVQGRGELRRELARCLRSGRAKRIRARRLENPPKIAGMIMISERPAEVEDRAVPGHWEGDLLMGKANKSAIGTLVERSTRFVMLFPLKDGRSAEHVREAMTKTIQTLPETLRRTLTWDQGREMADHQRFTIDTGVQVYFCDPHSPWQRGSNENTNGLLRQYFPKGLDLSKIPDADLQKAADGLNGRPRETLGWLKPVEKLTELLR